MKTHYFLTEKIDSEEIEHLQIAEESLFQAIRKWYLEQKTFPRINKELTKHFTENSNFKAEDVIKTFSAIYWLKKLFIEYSEDTPNDFVDDLNTIQPDLIKIDKEKFTKRVVEVYEIAKYYENIVNIENAKRIGAPMLKGASTSVILKPVFKERFDFDKQDIKEYKPVFQKFEPCILFELHDTSGGIMTFQMDCESFERFLNDMISLQIELNTIKNECN